MREEWALVAPYLFLCRAVAPRRICLLQEVFSAARYVVHAGVSRRYSPHEFQSGARVHEQTRCEIRVCWFEAVVNDVRVFRRDQEQQESQASAVMLDGRTLPCTPESERGPATTGRNGTRVRRVGAAVNRLEHLLTLPKRQDPDAIAVLVEQPRQVTGEHAGVADVGQGQSGDQSSAASAWRWLSTERPSGVPCSCPGAGWWHAVLPK